ncbi:MAG TPA: hypothetical protein VHO01_11365 [Jatrophihabitans sp.]|nr:hypothetical protein [Jatrophihabitans sp.]
MISTPARPDQVARRDALAGDRAALVRLAAGVVLGLLGVLVFAGSRYAAAQQNHAYDPGAVPPASFRVTAGKTYQLSSTTPTRQLIAQAALSTLACTWTGDGRLENQLPVTSVLNDERNRFEFALFEAPISGSIQIRCAGMPAVFVDDADDSSPDWAGLLLIVATLFGLAGGVLAVQGGYQLTG